MISREELTSLSRTDNDVRQKVAGAGGRDSFYTFRASAVNNLLWGREK